MDLDVPQEAPAAIGFFKFFRYMGRFERVLFGVGTFSAIVAGIILPSISVIMANVASAFSTGGGSAMSNNMSYIASYVVIIACGLFTFSYMFYAFWQQLAENITIDLRKRYLAALMEQEIGYFDKNRVE